MPWATASAPHPLPGAVSWLPRGPPRAQALNPRAIIKQTLTWAAAARDARLGHRGNAGATAQPHCALPSPPPAALLLSSAPPLHPPIPSTLQRRAMLLILLLFLLLLLLLLLLLVEGEWRPCG